jgi:hypothetical protein
MPARHLKSAPRYRRMGLVTALVGLLLAAVGGLVTSPASAANTAPVKIVIDQVSSDVTAPSGTPSGAVPYVLVQAGHTFHVQVSFYDATGAPASFQQDTKLAITSNRGTLTPSTGTAPGGKTSATLDTSLPTAANQVSLTVAVAGRKGARTVTAGTSTKDQFFDVVSDLKPVQTEPNVSTQAGIGGDDSSCTNATKADPVCGSLILPHGAQSSGALLTLGACDTTYAGCSSTKGSVVQALADLSGLYTKSDPATLVVTCDKTLCGTGAIRDIPFKFSLDGNGEITDVAQPCPAKSTVGAEAACVDYVQSKRDGAGDTHLYLLFDQDMRGSVG